MKTMSLEEVDDVVQELTAFYEWSVACCGFPLGLQDLQMLASCLMGQREELIPLELVDRLVMAAMSASNFRQLGGTEVCTEQGGQGRASHDFQH
jgi:hypothetical protein